MRLRPDAKLALIMVPVLAVAGLIYSLFKWLAS